jgi:large repetitive protein
MPTHDATTTGTEIASASTLTISHTTGSGSNRCLRCGVSWNSTGGITITGVTYNGVALTSTTQYDSPYSNFSTQQWYLAAPASGANNLVITFSASTSFANAGVSTYTDVDQASPVYGVTGANMDTSPYTVTATSAVGDLVVDSVASQAVLTMDGAQTARWNAIQASISTAGSQKAGGASVAMSWTFTAPQPGAISAMSLRAAAADTPTGWLMPPVVMPTTKVAAVSSGMTPPQKVN